MNDERKPLPVPTWAAFRRSCVALEQQGFELVQLATSLPGNGFEVVTVTVRKPEERAA